jgi:hypothetical protein
MSHTLAPLEGDPQQLLQLVESYKELSRRLLDARVALRNVANENVFISDAISEVRTAATATAEDTLNVYLRYKGAADALGQYAIVLASAQTAANGARDRFAQAQSDATEAARLRDYYEELARTPGPEQQDFLRQFMHHKEAHEIAIAQEFAADAAYDQAVADRDAAAKLASSRIEFAMKLSGTNDTVWDNVEGALKNAYKFAQEYLAPVLEAIRTVAEALADALSTIGFILLFIPGLHQFGAALLTIAGVLSIVALAATALLFVLGKETLGNVIKSALKFAVKKLGGVIAKKIMGGLTNAVFSHPNFISKTLSIASIEYLLPIVTEGVGETVDTFLEMGATHFQLYENVSFSTDYVVDFYGVSDSVSGDWNVPPAVETPVLNLPANGGVSEMNSSVDTYSNDITAGLGRAGGFDIPVSISRIPEPMMAAA